MLLRRAQRFVPFFLICVIFFSYFLIDLSNSGNKKKYNLKSTNKTKYILYWSPFWKWWDYQLGFGFEPFKNCKYNNCYATRNKSYIPLEEFDALIFHANHYLKQGQLPRIRKPNQIYIFMNWEPPIFICPNLKKYNSYFNWTMTYRFDSDIIRRHGYFFKMKTNYTTPSKPFIQNKTKLATWFVSHCKTKSKREILGNELKKFVKVDVYGRCGNLTCPRKAKDPKISSEECYEMIEKNYKFYFSFENSYCTDYSTEKLYNILLKNIVPVVYGGGDYGLSAPPNSVINVADFDNASKLADYLEYLNKNIGEYLKYFQWKKDYKLTRSLEPSACQMCEKLHQPLKQSIYHDLHEWWWGKNKSICKQEKDLPRIVSDVL